MEDGSFVDLCLYATVLGTKGWADGGERPEGVVESEKVLRRYRYVTVLDVEGWAESEGGRALAGLDVRGTSADFLE